MTGEASCAASSKCSQAASYDLTDTSLPPPSTPVLNHLLKITPSSSGKERCIQQTNQSTCQSQ